MSRVHFAKLIPWLNVARLFSSWIFFFRPCGLSGGTQADCVRAFIPGCISERRAGGRNDCIVEIVTVAGFESFSSHISLTPKNSCVIHLGASDCDRPWDEIYSGLALDK